MTTSSKPKVVVTTATSQEDMAACMAIRKEVFIDEQGYDIRIETNDDDAVCTHFLARSDGKPAGTVRVRNADGQLGRLAISAPFRGTGLARPLCNAVADHMREIGGKEVWCQSQAADTVRDGSGVDATGLYRKLGYVPRGDFYIKEGTRHLNMALAL